MRFFSRMRGGGFGGRGGGTGEGDSEEQDGARAAATRVTAVADEHSNSVVVNAPQDLMTEISALVAEVDVAVDDMLQLRVFPLRYANAETIAKSVTDLFSTSSANASSRMRRAPTRSRATPRERRRSRSRCT